MSKLLHPNMVDPTTCPHSQLLPMMVETVQVKMANDEIRIFQELRAAVCPRCNMVNVPPILQPHQRNQILRIEANKPDNENLEVV